MGDFDGYPVGVPIQYAQPRRMFVCVDCREPCWLPREQRCLPDGRLLCARCARRRGDGALWRCSRCGAAYRDEHTCPAVKRYVPVTRTARPCVRCGRPFTARRSDAKYCSTRCRVAAYRAR